MSADGRDRLRVVIAGGGVAALETLLALRALAGRSVELTVISPERDFLYRPVTVAEAFDRGEAREYPLAEIVSCHGGGLLIWDSLAEVDPDNGGAITGSGKRIPFDALVVATGAVATEPLPGALTFRGRTDVPRLRGLLQALAFAGSGSVALALPSERMWPLPIYELALMTARHLREHDASEVKVSLVTPEEEPLDLFGPAATRAIAPVLEARGIELLTSSRPAIVKAGSLILAGGARIAADEVITVPVLEGPRLGGLPHDRHGFIPVDEHGRVDGLSCVYAAGDVTAFALKQGGLATQQADAIAEMIAADAGADLVPKPFTTVLRGLLMTGGPPLYLRCEPDAGDATAVSGSSGRDRDASAAAGQALWWPPAKIAGRYLAPYLASTQRSLFSAQPLIDRAAIPGPPVSDSEYQDALELSLLLADCDARWGDYRSALSALDAAESLEGALPHEYETKRREWRAADLAGSQRAGHN